MSRYCHENVLFMMSNYHSQCIKSFPAEHLKLKKKSRMLRYSISIYTVILLSWSTSFHLHHLRLCCHWCLITIWSSIHVALHHPHPKISGFRLISCYNKRHALGLLKWQTEDRGKADIEYGLIFLMYETCTQRANSQTSIYHHYIVQILHLDCNELNTHKPLNHIKVFQVFTVQTVQTVVFHTFNTTKYCRGLQI